MFEYERLSECYFIHSFRKPITRMRVHHIARTLFYSGGVDFGIIPDDVLAIIRPQDKDPLVKRVNNAIDWAIEDGYLKIDSSNPEILLPCNC